MLLIVKKRQGSASTVFAFFIVIDLNARNLVHINMQIRVERVFIIITLLGSLNSFYIVC